MANRSNVFWLVIGSVLAATGVGLGAFGAHGLVGFLENRVTDPAASMDNWNTGSRYWMYHAFGILVIGLTSATIEHRKLFDLAGGLFVVGITLFCGSLYLLAVTDLKILGAIVPLGGLSMIAGWLTLAVGLLSVRKPAGTKTGNK